jgi:hypothetical protein
MRLIKIITIIMLISGLMACQNAALISETKVTATPENIENLVLYLEPNLFYQLKTGRYLDSIKSALEKKFQKNGFETQIVEISDSVIDEGQLNASIKRLKPTHIFRMRTISAMTVNGIPQNITWQIEVHQRSAKLNTNTFEAAVIKNQNKTTDLYKSIYKFNVQSEICIGLRALRASTCADEFASTVEAALIKNSIK